MNREIVADLIDFVHASPTPYHAVESATTRLVSAGFGRLDEREAWSELRAGRYIVEHEQSALVAFVVPKSRRPSGFRITMAHTDSPNLRLKPNAEYTKEGYGQLGVEVYGGALLNSWLDRDLSLAGRARIRQPSGIVTRLFRIDRPLLRIPQLAIHLDRDVNERGLLLNRQEHLAPIWSLRPSKANSLDATCADELGVDSSAIVRIEAMLYDVNPPVIAGNDQEFLFAPRLDNLAMCHASVAALARAAAVAEAHDGISIVALFDHEEVGSGSDRGAASTLLPRILERIVLGLGGNRGDYLRALAQSVCISADMAHAVHPNYADRHEPRHRPQINGGPVVKVNSQQRYATSSTTAAYFLELCQEARVPSQTYVHRTDLPCGSTIGPIASTLLGIPTVDVGNAMLSMHSVREMAGTEDPEHMVRVIELFAGGTFVYDLRSNV